MSDYAFGDDFMNREQRFESLARPHLSAAYNLSCWLLNNRGDAEDCVQDACVRAWRAFNSWRGEDFKPWFLAIVRNVAYRRLRERSRQGKVISIDSFFSGNEFFADPSAGAALTEPSPPPDDCLISAQDNALLLQAIAGLPEPLREVIVLREMEEMSYAEIAAATGSPAGTVMSRLSRAREALKRILHDDFKRKAKS